MRALFGRTGELAAGRPDRHRCRILGGGAAPRRGAPTPGRVRPPGEPVRGERGGWPAGDLVTLGLRTAAAVARRPSYIGTAGPQSGALVGVAAAPARGRGHRRGAGEGVLRHRPE